MEGGGDYFKYYMEHDFVVERFASEIKAGQLKLKRCGTSTIQEQLKCIEQGVTIFGTEDVPKWIQAGVDGLFD